MLSFLFPFVDFFFILCPDISISVAPPGLSGSFLCKHGSRSNLRPNPPLTTSGVRDSVATAPWPRPSSGVAVGTRAVPSPSTGVAPSTAPAIQSTTATPSVQAVMPSDAAQAHARALWSHLALLPLHGNDVRGLVKRFNDVASDCFQLGWSLSDVALCDLFRSKFKCNPLYDDLLRTHSRREVRLAVRCLCHSSVDD